ncbi:hypothetical protein [Erwinia sp.]|uniref:hypothetical protein n=1 Tax=Erwinia citreus TaxID=558 RepID=UPI00289B13CA|nr:hypothetical protein [Erwinia sp.]
MYTRTYVFESSEGLIGDMYVLSMLEGELMYLKARKNLNLTELQQFKHPYTINDALMDVASRLGYATTCGRFSSSTFTDMLAGLNTLGKEICQCSWDYGTDEGSSYAQIYLAEPDWDTSETAI